MIKRGPFRIADASKSFIKKRHREASQAVRQPHEDWYASGNGGGLEVGELRTMLNMQKQMMNSVKTMQLLIWKKA